MDRWTDTWSDREMDGGLFGWADRWTDKDLVFSMTFVMTQPQDDPWWSWSTSYLRKLSIDPVGKRPSLSLFMLHWKKNKKYSVICQERHKWTENRKVPRAKRSLEWTEEIELRSLQVISKEILSKSIVKAAEKASKFALWLLTLVRKMGKSLTLHALLATTLFSHVCWAFKPLSGTAGSSFCAAEMETLQAKVRLWVWILQQAGTVSKTRHRYGGSWTSVNLWPGWLQQQRASPAAASDSPGGFMEKDLWLIFCLKPSTKKTVSSCSHSWVTVVYLGTCHGRYLKPPPPCSLSM